MVNLEENYYQQIALPELLFVLRVDPEVAVRRKTEENASYVRERSNEIWNLDDQELDAYIVDASRGKEEVLSEIKQRIWSAL